MRELAPVVQRLDNAIHLINHYPVDSVVCFVRIFPLDSDLSGGLCYPAFKQLGPGCSAKGRLDWIPACFARNFFRML